MTTQVTSGVIGDNSITSSKIANSAVTETKINDGAVTSSKMSSTGVTAGAYTAANITVDAAGRVTAANSNVVGDVILLVRLNEQSAVPVDTQTFNASGTWTKPSGGSLALIEVWGAGGSGARNTIANNARPGGGGAYGAAYVSLGSLPSTVSVTVGSGGASRTGSNQNGVNGGSSSFGSYVSSLGGNGGQSGLGTGSVSGATITTESTTQSWPRPLRSGASSTLTLPEGGAGEGGAPVRSGACGGVADNSVTAGTSLYGGNGGAGGATGEAGATPGGGGGGGTSTSGAGGGGRVRITVF